MAAHPHRLAAAALAATLLWPAAALASPHPEPAASPTSSSTAQPAPPPALLPELARQLGVSPQRLEAAVRSAVLERWKGYVRDHAVAPERAAAVERRIAGAPLTLHVHFGHRLPGGLLGAAAGYLGLDRAALAQELRQGRSLAEIAAARGKSPAGLREALHAAAQQELDRRVAEGEMTPAARDRVLGDLSARLQALIERRLPAPPEGRAARGRTQPLAGLSPQPPHTAP